MKRYSKHHSIAKRSVWPVLFISIAVFALGARAVQLQVYQHGYWQKQGQARFQRKVEIIAHRGVITDRHGEPLAISTPLDTVSISPQTLKSGKNKMQALAKLLKISNKDLHLKIKQHKNKSSFYIKRQITPEVAEKVSHLDIAGVRLEREYRRFYPDKETTAHVVGFTDVDDMGQEGIELAYDDSLRGHNGIKQIIKDRDGKPIEHVQVLQVPQPGKELTLSLDKHIQYLAHKELNKVVSKHRARAGSVVILDVGTGEVLAMVNQPSYNPHVRGRVDIDRFRNRAVTDVFEPGSTIKPFIIATALSSGQFVPGTLVDTAPGFMHVGQRKIRDHHNNGQIDLTTILRVSSNVGASKIALAIKPKLTWRTLSDLGFGKVTRSGFPGEVSGVLRHYSQWTKVDRATLAYGYGISVTALKLAQAYAALANRGRMVPVSFVRKERQPYGVQVIPSKVATQISLMLESVVEQGGTGQRANVKGYRIAGKTGTVRKIVGGRYVQDRYISIFAGFAPVSNPRLAMVVVVDSPTRGGYYGGVVAAPVFAQVMTGALRRLNVSPDDFPASNVQLALGGYGSK